MPLRHLQDLYEIEDNPCLNPCYSGCASSAADEECNCVHFHNVLILVILDVPLRLRKTAVEFSMMHGVLILVILDVPLRLLGILTSKPGAQS